MSQITSFTIVYSTVYTGADQRKHKAPRQWPLCGIHQWPVNSTHKWPVTRKRFPFDDIMWWTEITGLMPLPVGSSKFKYREPVNWNISLYELNGLCCPYDSHQDGMLHWALADVDEPHNCYHRYTFASCDYHWDFYSHSLPLWTAF